jgi:serine/threonine protein kinase
MSSVDLETVINQMQGDELFRKTLFKVHEKSPVKKKTQLPTKLPSMRVSHTIATGYAMGEVLGEGGYGRVRLCTRREDSQQVVIKTFAKFKLTTEEKRRSVMREIEIMKCIKHRSIIRIVDFFETSDSINIVMEHFSRVSLAAYARTNRPIPDTALRKIIKQIAEAIAYLHRMKITHRDLKPENVLINE